MAKLFGYTSFYPETSIKPSEWIKAGQGYNINKLDHEPIYAETKEKFQELYQPINNIEMPINFNEFPINDIGRTYNPTFGLNSSYYNGLIGNLQQKPYGTEIYIPPSYPNHAYNTNRVSPLFLALK